MKSVLKLLGAFLLVLMAYLLTWPIPIQPVSWLAPKAPGYQGPHAVNDKLAQLNLIELKGEEGPEHIAIGPDGKLYTTVASGKILQMNPDGSEQKEFANTGGRVLGFDFDAKGNLIAADAFIGLLSISPQGKIAVLTEKVGNDPIRYADAVVVAKNGKMYFSDASTRFSPKEWGGTFEASILDILEQSATGRILEYDSATNSTRILAQGLSFANGVALNQSETSLFVNETGKYRVWKIALDAQNLQLGDGTVPSGAKVLLQNLPGYPDNLMRGLDGKIWLGFAKPRNPTIDGFADKPWLRSLTLRLPRAMWPIPKAYGHVMAFDEEGRILKDMQDPTGSYPESTGVTETKDRLYIQSLHAKGLGWLAK
jgi:sugar lactone lactonase YvrE